MDFGGIKVAACAHILRGTRAQLRCAYVLVHVACLIIFLSAPWMFIRFNFLLCVFDILAFQNAVHPIWHLLRRASWYCVGWLLDGHWNLKRNYAVYAYDIYVSV